MSTAPSTLAGRYELLHEIGRGGAASVHVARDTHLERQVAVKLLHPELASALGHGRFLREIRIASGLRHPHIVPVLDFGESEGRLWYAMPYLEGGSLRTRLEREGQLRMESTLRWGAEVADALAFAHAQGFVHRDVKPENLLLDGDHALLADFGIARGIDAATRETLTSAGIAVGTPAYMSPEQASGSGEIDGRSDVYSLGCVLYECLAGVPPFTGPTPQSIIAQRFAHAPHPVTSYRDTVSAPVAELIESALHMAPADRPGAAEACTILRGEWTGELRLSGRRSGAGAAVPARRISTRSRVAAIAGVAAIAAVMSAMWPSAPALDPGKVVIYPLVNGASTVGGVSSLIGLALENVPSVRWVEGEQLVNAPSSDPGTSHRERLKAARRAGAGHFIDGSVVVTDDSARVVMRLVDVEDDSIVARAGASARGNAAVAPTLALRAVGQLLPQLLAPDTQGDVLALSERNPAAIAAFLVGESEFRQSRYVDALARYQEALAIDSNLAVAALKAARSARSLLREDEARRFVALALTRDSLLPGANLPLARGLARLYMRDAPGALLALGHAASLAPGVADIESAIGDVYFYVGTDSSGGVDADSAAYVHYARARARDSSFTPALYHLAMLAARRRSPDTTAALLDAYRRGHSPDTTFVRSMQIATECQTRGIARVSWSSLASSTHEAVMQVGKGLAGGGSNLPCARAAALAAFTASGAPSVNHWGGLLALSAIAAASRDPALLRMIGANETGVALRAANVLLLAAAGDSTLTRLGVDAGRIAHDMHARLASLGPDEAWILGVWFARRGDIVALRAVAQRLQALHDGGRASRAMLQSISARVALLDGDTTTALRWLSQTDSTATASRVEWSFYQSGAADNVLMAEIAQARSEWARADRLAERLDHPSPISNMFFVRRSLEIRRDAAVQRRDMGMARRMGARLRAWDSCGIE